MLKKYIFLHNCSQFTGTLPAWKYEDYYVADLINLAAWTSLCYQYSKGLVGGGSVEGLLEEYVKGSIVFTPKVRSIQDYEDIQIENMRVSYMDVLFLTKEPYTLDEDYQEKLIMSDDGPYSEAFEYYLKKGGKVLGMELLFRKGTSARKISVPTTLPESNDFVHADELFTKYILGTGIYEYIYEL